MVDPGRVQPPTPGPAVAGPRTGLEWFHRMRPWCNPVDVAKRVEWEPAPDTEDGHAYEAACYALAGDIERARGAIESLPPHRRHVAAAIVFNVGHPVADAGDERAAGPLMELVVEYWPNHYMALYHAGSYSFQVGDRMRARDYLTRFVREYPVEDGWRVRARAMLEAIEG